MSTVAYYGGSFDPPHSGHQRVVLEALVHSGADYVWVAPAYAHADGKRMAPYNDRVAMCCALIAPFDREAVRVSRVEEWACARGGKGLTADVVDALLDHTYVKQNFQGAHPPIDKVLLVVGHDVALALGTWEGYDRLLAHIQTGRLELFLVTRPVGSESSTEIRGRFAADAPIGRLVPPAVGCYVNKYGLY